MRTMESDQHSSGVPKRRQKHYSYDESVDEPAKLLEEEAVDVEEAAPLEDNESVEGADEQNNGVGPAFED
jgi:hypothetical protein